MAGEHKTWTRRAANLSSPVVDTAAKEYLLGVQIV